MHQIITNTFWLTAGELAGRALRIALVLYAARALGAAEWGIASYALSWATLFTIATDLGLHAILTREAARHENEVENAATLRAALSIKSALLIISAVLMAFLPFISSVPLSPALIMLTFALVASDSLRLIPSAINKARERMHREAVITLVTQGTILTLGLFLVLKRPSAESLALAYAVGSAIGTLAAAYAVREILPRLKGSINFARARAMLRAAWPIALIGMLGSLMLNTDIIMIGWLGTPEDIGYYSAAQKIIFTLYVLGTLIASAAFPTFSRAAHANEAFAPVFKKTMQSSVTLAVILAGILILAARPIITIAYGANYLPAVAPFVILLCTLPLAYAASLITNALVAHHKEHAFISYAALGAIGNVIGNLLLIPLWGIAGAALATFVTQGISTLLMARKIKNILPTPARKPWP